MLKIIEQAETNPYENSSMENNGGGYSQPLVTFIFKGKQGIYHDTSCGDFGSRRTIELNGSIIYSYDSVGNTPSYYDFNQEEVINVVASHFGFYPMSEDIQ